MSTDFRSSILIILIILASILLFALIFKLINDTLGGRLTQRLFWQGLKANCMNFSCRRCQIHCRGCNCNRDEEGNSNPGFSDDRPPPYHSIEHLPSYDDVIQVPDNIYFIPVDN